MVIRLEDTDGSREEEAAAPRVDERGCPHAEGTGARRNKDDCDRAQAEANLGRDVSAGKETRGIARGAIERRGGTGTPRKRVQFDHETWQALERLRGIE